MGRGRLPSVLACLAALVAIALLGGCGREEESTPVACLEGSKAYLKALAAAPGGSEVRVGDENEISECLVENQQGGDISRVGEGMLEATTALNAEARSEPGGDANLELGYLLGAVERGAEASEGIHAELLRRLEAAARFAPGRQPLSPEFLATYRQGFDAGHAGG